MGRELHIKEDELVLKLTGVHPLFAFKRSVRMPYSAIRSVMVDHFEAPVWMLRMPGTSIAPLNIYEGSFKFGNEWYFLSYAHKDPLVIIEMTGMKYRFVIFEMDDPTQAAAEIRREISIYDAESKSSDFL